jgi:hypothetical protein
LFNVFKIICLSSKFCKNYFKIQILLEHLQSNSREMTVASAYLPIELAF